MGFFEQFFTYGNTVFKSTCGNEHGSGWNAGEKRSFQFSSVTQAFQYISCSNLFLGGQAHPLRIMKMLQRPSKPTLPQKKYIFKTARSRFHLKKKPRSLRSVSPLQVHEIKSKCCAEQGHMLADILIFPYLHKRYTWQVPPSRLPTISP